MNRVSEGLQNLTTLQVSDNLSRAEHRALQSLSNNPDLVIKNADKGSGIVVEDRESYIKDATIKFTYECSSTTVDFLDLTLYKGPRFELENKLDSKPFFKKTKYLQYSSAHPRNTFQSLIKGELMRLLRACSDEQQYTLIKNKMNSKTGATHAT